MCLDELWQTARECVEFYQFFRKGAPRGPFGIQEAGDDEG
jgi:hypothetical protein